MKLRAILTEDNIPVNKKYIVRESFKYIRTQMELLERELDSNISNEDFQELCENVIFGISEKTAQMERNLKR